MHPLYKQTRLKVRVVGTLAISVGVLGIVAPFVPGLALLVVGCSILTMQSNSTYKWVAVFRSKHPELSHYLRTLETWMINFFNLTTHTRDYVDVPRRDGTTLATLVEISPINAGVAILLHSATGTKETPIMHTFAEALLAQGLTVIRFDASQGLGDGEQTSISFTGSSMYEDLEDIMAWARNQDWWHDELTLLGHSIGGLVSAHYSAEHPGEVHQLVLFAPMVSGVSYLETLEKTDPEGLARWRAEGFRSVSHPLTQDTYQFSYEFVTDACSYNLVAEAPNIQSPTRILVGSRDRTTTEAQCRQFAQALGVRAQMAVIPGLTHTPKNRSDLAKVHRAVLALPVNALARIRAQTTI